MWTAACRRIPRRAFIPAARSLVGRRPVRALSSAAEMEGYTPPKVWKDKERPGVWGKLNQPYAGARETRDVPRGEHALQLYSLATPNGMKAGIFLEELYDQYKVEYDAWPINISEGDQFTSGFVQVNPNSKIPALLHYTDDLKEPVRVFESASVLLYLADTFDTDHHFVPKDPKLRAECISWLFWQVGAAPSLGGGGFKSFFSADVKIESAIDKYGLRALDPNSVDGEFLGLSSYPNVMAWAQRVADRKAVQRGQRVNQVWGDESEQLAERHSRTDFD